MPLNRVILVLTILLSLMSQAPANGLQPCGTLLKSTRLTQDCLAPMIIGSDNITVDLDNHAVYGVPELRSGSIVVVDRRGVTVKNGRVSAPLVLDDRYGLWVLNGGGHTFRNLTFETVAVRLVDVDRTLVRRVSVVASQSFPNAADGCFRFFGTNSRIERVSAVCGDSAGGVIAGSAVTVTKSDFSSQERCGLALPAERSTVRGNTLRTQSTDNRLGGLCAAGYTNLIKGNTILGVASGLVLPSTADGFVIRNNYISSEPSTVPDAIDIRAGINACTNTWKNNTFKTDSEGDGPNAGCIR